MTSLMEKEIIAESPDLVYYAAHWVPLYYDTDQTPTEFRKIKTA